MVENNLKNKTGLFTHFYANEGKENVIILHGGPGTPEDVRPLIAHLLREFQVIYFHQRGTAKSPCPSSNYSMEEYIGDIDKVADYFQLKKFHLLGHSWGGLYAGIYAEKRQERLLSMFLCNPASGTGKQWLEMQKEVARYNRKKSTFREWLEMIFHSFMGSLGVDQSAQKMFRQFAVNCNKGHRVKKTAPMLLPLIKASSVNGTTKAILKYPKLQQLRHPRFKITVTYGDDDIYGNSTRYVWERYPEGRFVTLRGCGHMSWLHNPAEFYEVLDKHFDFSN